MAQANTSEPRTIAGSGPSRQRGYFLETEGERLFLLEDKVAEPKANVIMVSPFGRTVHDLFLLAYNLTYNGCNVFRFDPRNHVGASTGVMDDFTLSSLDRDTAVTAYAFDRTPGIPTIILGMSLSFPVALKFGGRSDQISAVISVVGVVDTEYTLSRAAGVAPEDYRQPVITAPTLVEPFGCRVRAKHFVDGMDAAGYGKRAEVDGYMAACDKPLYMIAAEADEYVSIDDVATAFALHRGEGELERMPGVSHEIGRSVDAARRVADRVVAYALRVAKAPAVGEPSLVEFVAQSQRETEYLNSFE